MFIPHSELYEKFRKNERIAGRQLLSGGRPMSHVLNRKQTHHNIMAGRFTVGHTTLHVHKTQNLSPAIIERFTVDFVVSFKDALQT